MSRLEFERQALALVEGQGEETFLALALAEVGIHNVEDVPNNLFEWVLGRTTAMYEEEL